LRRIASGEINSRQLPENAALLARCEHEAIPVSAVVLHLPTAHVNPRSAA
jgi:WhiB family transcriptional regulator, redox-sensing transcriptional regulator